MRTTSATIAIILLGAAFVVAGNGLLQTMLPMRSDLEGFSTAMIGLQGTGYFGGFIAGCVLGPRLIKSVGHIRAFAGVVALLAALVLIFPIWIHPIAWIGIRLVTGICLAVTYMSLESWLNDQATNANRGSILSLYFILTNAGWIGGQLAINLASLAGATLFLLATISICLAVGPVALTPTREPTPIPDARLDLPGLVKLSLVGTVGCFLVGMAEGAFWTLGPVFGQQRGMAVFEVTLLMGAFVLGGSLSQWPIGRISDNHDRRVVILPVALATIVTGLIMAYTGNLSAGPTIALAVAHGALMLPIYALCLAHVNDSAPTDRFVQVSSGLLLIYSAGAALGPLAAAPLMDRFGPGGLFIFVSGVLGAFALVIAYRLVAARHLIRLYPARYRTAMKTTQSIYEIEGDDASAPEDHP